MSLKSNWHKNYVNIIRLSEWNVVYYLPTYFQKIYIFETIGLFPFSSISLLFTIYFTSKYLYLASKQHKSQEIGKNEW